MEKASKVKPEVGQTVYVTRWFLTQGIQRLKCADPLNKAGQEKAIICEYPGGLNDELFLYGSVWHLTMAEAKADANAQINARLKSIEKSTAKLLALRDSLEREP